MEICGPQPQIPPYRPEPEPESGAGGGGGQSDIDLSLPITSTYLRKMRCGGTDMMQFWSTTPQQVGLFFIFCFFSRKSISELIKSEDRNLYFSHFVRYFITNVEDIYLHLKGCFYKKKIAYFIQQTFYLISQEMELRTFSQLVSSHFPFHFSWDSYNLHYCCFSVGMNIGKQKVQGF